MKRQREECLSSFASSPGPISLLRKSSKFEGFAVRILPASKVQTPKTNLRSYARNHERIARASFSVADWRRRRFDAVYPEYDVEVLFGDGRPASPRTLLLKVRASYD